MNYATKEKIKEKRNDLTKNKNKSNKKSGDALREAQQIISELRKKGIIIKPTPIDK